MTGRFRTRVTELLGIEHPILCGGLMWLSDAAYVAAVVNAGAMGFITARSFPERGAFRRELQRCRDLTGGRPFGVNLYISQRPEENEILKTHSRILVEEGVRLVETSGLLPKAYLPDLKARGVTVIHKVSQVRHAVSAERAGADAVVVVGMECGGHPGLTLIGTVVQSLVAAQRLSVPVIAAGGIGHGSQLVAALALGAEAVLLGTRMTVAAEIWAHRAYKERVVAAGETDTRLILASFRNTYRALDNEAARAVAEMEAAGITDYEPYRPLVAGQTTRAAYASGDWESAILSLGQAAVFADAVEPVADILARFLAEAAAARERVAGSVAST